MIRCAYRAFVIAVILLTLLAGAVNATDYFPLFVGMHSTFRGFDPESGYYYPSWSIDSTKSVGGTMTCVVQLAGMPDFNGYFAMARVNGALKILEVGSLDTGAVVTSMTWLPANPTVGAQWTYTDQDGQFYTATVLATETVTTPAGTFQNCIKVKRQGGSSYQLDWYAPEVGQVKYRDEGGSIKESEELVSFTQSRICDSTPPSPPVIGGDTPDTYGNALRGSWTSSDPESGVVQYQVALSTTPSERGIISEIGWNSQAGMTETTSEWIGQFLQDGQTYYALVRARNGAGLWGDVGVSSPVTVHKTPLGTSPWPMQVGNSWKYQIHSSESGDRVGVVSVTRTTQVGGQTRYVASVTEGYYRYDDPPREMTAAWSNGDMIIYVLDGEEEGSLVIAKDPLTAGQHWSCLESDGGTTRFEVLADNQTVVTPAGTFTGCLKVGQKWDDHPDSLDYFWYKPGVGLVQSESYEDYDWANAREHRVLSDWHLSAGPTDITPPTTPAVVDDGSDSYGNILKAHWVCGDPESALVDYMVAVSTTPNESGIISDAPWRSTCGSNMWTSQFPSGIQHGGTYYILVKALNSAGLWSAVGASDGIAVHDRIPASDLWPLHPANRWLYAKHDYSTGLDSRITATVRPAVMEGDLVSETVNLRGSCDSVVVGNQQDGFYLYATDGQPLSPAWRQLTYPVYEGQTSTRNTMTVTVEELHDNITVPAGTCSGCLRLRVDLEGGIKLYDWFAPGVGVVKEDIYQGTFLVSTESLLGYYLRSTDSITGIKQSGDGTSISLRGAVVSAAWPDVFYVEAEGRNCGIRVEKAGHGLGEGDRADLSGVLKTDDDGERYIQATEAVFAGSGTVMPLGMTIRSAGGSSWRHDPIAETGQRGITGGSGLNNIGLLVRLFGHVAERDPSPDPRWFILDDGSGAGVRCELPDGVTYDRSWEYLCVVGVSSLYSDTGTFRSRILIRESSDVVSL